MDDLFVQKKRISDAGFKTVPIPVNKKAPPPLGYPQKTEQALWQGISMPSNMGIVAGENRLVIIDADDHKTQQSLENFFSGLGVSHVGSNTRRGSHWWLKTTMPDRYTKKSTKLANPLNGDVRLKNGYALVSPSIVKDFIYEQAGTPSEVQDIAWKDFVPLLCPTTTDSQPAQGAEGLFDHFAPFIPLRRRMVKPWVSWLSKRMIYFDEGEPINHADHHWDSRSAAVFSAYQSLILRGYSFQGCLNYLELEDRQRAWHERTYKKALLEIHWPNDLPSNRPDILVWYHTPIAFLENRIGSSLYAVYLAILGLAWLNDTKELNLPLRELALLAAVSETTVEAMLPYLERYGLIERIDCKILVSGNPYYKYRLNHPLRIALNNNSNGVVVNNSKSGIDGLINWEHVSYAPKYGHFQELWRREALGKAALQVFMALGESPLSEGDIGAFTGLCRGARYNALNRLEQEKLAIHTGKKWIRDVNRLPLVIYAYNCAEAAFNRRQKTIQDRRKYAARFTNDFEAINSFTSKEPLS